MHFKMENKYFLNKKHHYKGGGTVKMYAYSLIYNFIRKQAIDILKFGKKWDFHYASYLKNFTPPNCEKLNLAY